MRVCAFVWRLPRPAKPCEQGVLDDFDFVGRLFVGLALLVSAWFFGYASRRDVLNQRASKGDIHHLHAAAYSQDGEIGGMRLFDECLFECIATGVSLEKRSAERLAVKRRIDIAPSRKNHAVNAGKHGGHVGA